MGTRTSDVWKAVSDALLGKPELLAREVAPLAGLSSEEGRRFWQSLGFSAFPRDEAAFTKRDVDALGHIADLIEDDESPDREMLLQMARATGQALSRIAHMHVLSIAERVDEVARSKELSNNEAADRITELAESLVRSHEPFLGYIWRRHVVAAISHVVANASAVNGKEEGMTIGFADLVDFTAASQHLSEEELAEAVDHFERIAYQEIPDRGGRVVKTLGDEVMFSHTSAHGAADIALALAAACEADDILPHVRVGMALGTALAFEGDLYGPIVNLAHRLVGVARPGTVIVSQDLAKRLEGEESFDLVEIRDVKLKGIGRTTPWVLRRKVPKK